MAALFGVDLDKLSRAELETLSSAVSAKLDALRVLEDTAQEIVALNSRYLDFSGRERGQEWVKPTSTVDSYPKGWTVMRNGKEWVSMLDFNTWEPGTSGWQRTSPDPALPPEWVRPSSTVDAYQKGQQVVYKGSIYESVHPGPNTWSPDDYPAAWKLIRKL